MLEAIQMTFMTHPTLLSRFPGGRKIAFRWVMIPGNEPSADGRYVGITTITEAQWASLAHVIGRDDMAADDDLRTMIGRFMKADEVNGALHAWTTAHDADEIVADLRRRPRARHGRRQRRRAAALRPSRRARRVRDAAGRGVDPAARAVPLPRHRRPPTRCTASRRVTRAAWSARSTSRSTTTAGTPRRPAARGTQGARLHRVLGRTVRDRVAVRDGRRRDQGRSGAAPRRHPVQRGRTPETGSALLREVGRCSTRATSASAASRSISATPTASRSRSA